MSIAVDVPGVQLVLRSSAPASMAKICDAPGVQLVMRANRARLTDVAALKTQPSATVTTANKKTQAAVTPSATTVAI